MFTTANSRHHVWAVSAAMLLLSLEVPSAVAQRDEPRKYALLIGVNEYREGQGLPKLSYAEKDIDDLESRLIYAGYHVTKLTAEAGIDRVTRVPTARNIRDAIARVIGNPNLQEQDTIIVALAGHGVTVRVQQTELDSVEEKFFFCPTDADLRPLVTRANESDFPSLDEVEERYDLISIDELYESLADYDSETRTGCRAGLRLVMVDACRDDPSRPSFSRAANSLTIPAIPPPPGGLVTLFSCSTHERAYEDPTLEHGVFFHFVIEGLGGSADLDRDGEVAISELNQYVSRAVYDFVLHHYDGVQNPELTGHIRGRFALLANTQLPEGTREGELRVFEALPDFRMVWIPAGRFTMGSPESEEGHQFDEGQVHVELTNGFWIGETEVTQAQWQAVMRSEPWLNRHWATNNDDSPAVYISWDSAMEFCERLTLEEQRSGRLSENFCYTLPTEAQWEYAYRSNSRERFYWGTDEIDLEQHAWSMRTTHRTREYYAHEVARRLPNSWGLHDMAGGVWEWCRDEYVSQLPGGVDPYVIGETSVHVSRGGSWRDQGLMLRAAQRNKNSRTYSKDNLGFRIILVDEY